MKNLTLTLCLTVAVFLGSSACVPNSAKSNGLYDGNWIGTWRGSRSDCWRVYATFEVSGNQINGSYRWPESGGNQTFRLKGNIEYDGKFYIPFIPTVGVPVKGSISGVLTSAEFAYGYFDTGPNNVCGTKFVIKRTGIK